MSNTALAALAQKHGFDVQKFRDTIIKTCFPAKQISEEEFAAFVSVANQYNLNPLLKEIYAFPTKSGGLMPIVSIDGWIKIIKSSPSFDGMTFQDTLSENGQLVSITCRIRLKDIKDPIEVTEYLSECKRPTEPWDKWPARMLRHKATIQCARYAFGFAGIYDEDEAARINSPSLEEQPATSPAQREEITALIHECGADFTQVLSYVGAKAINELNEAQYHKAKAALLHRIQEKQQKALEQQQSANKEEAA